MKLPLILTTALLGAAPFTGCKPAADQNPPPPPPPANSSTTADALRAKAAEVQTATKDAVDDLQAFTYEQRVDFVAGLRKQTDALKRDLAVLETKIEAAGDSMKADARPRVAALRERIALLERQTQAAQDATPDTWDKIKAEVRKSYADLKEGFDDARQWTADKIAP